MIRRMFGRARSPQPARRSVIRNRGKDRLSKTIGIVAKRPGPVKPDHPGLKDIDAVPSTRYDSGHTNSAHGGPFHEPKASEEPAMTFKVSRGGPALLIALVTCVVPAAAHTLTFEERVRAQVAIESVYYSHQLGTTRSFEQ